MATRRGPKTKDRPTPPRKALPKAPKSLTADERKHWNQLADAINASGLGSSLDAEALSYLIAIWSRWRKAEAELAKSEALGGGVVITAPNKYRQLNPWYLVATEALKQLKSYLGEFGLTPKARSKLTMPDVEEIDSKWDDFED
jgi:P27 family predicted phage terminase small subunit